MASGWGFWQALGRRGYSRRLHSEKEKGETFPLPIHLRHSLRTKRMSPKHNFFWLSCVSLWRSKLALSPTIPKFLEAIRTVEKWKVFPAFPWVTCTITIHSQMTISQVMVQQIWSSTVRMRQKPFNCALHLAHSWSSEGSLLSTTLARENKFSLLRTIWQILLSLLPLTWEAGEVPAGRLNRRQWWAGGSGGYCQCLGIGRRAGTCFPRYPHHLN